MRKTAGGGRFTVKGIVHCHTDLSYDSHVSLADLCAALRREGFGFVALTEHSNGVTARDYGRFVAACRRESNGGFVAIPGLEIRCSDGSEIAGIGISEVPHSGRPSVVIAKIRKLGGYAIWVHPLKRRRPRRRFLNCDAIEILNCKIDGALAPNLTLLTRVRNRRRRQEQVHAIFGLDLHDIQTPRYVWTECRVSKLTVGAILDSLRAGRFVNRVANGTVTSSGRLGLVDSLRFGVLRAAYLFWDMALRITPGALRTLLSQSTRPLVKAVKRGR